MCGFFLIQLSKIILLYCHNISLITCMRLFQVSDYIWRSRTFNGMKFSGVVLSTLGLLLVLVPDSCIGDVCTSCMKHIHTKPNIPPPERRGRRARRDIIRAWPWPSLHHLVHLFFSSFIQITVDMSKHIIYNWLQNWNFP